MTTQTTPKTLRELSLIKLAFPEEARLREISMIPLDRDGVPHSALEDSLRAISRRFERFPLKGRALDLYTNNRINLVSNKDTIKVPTILPAWRVAGRNGVNAIVNVTQYTPASGPSNIDIRKLFGFLQIGAVLIDTYALWSKLTLSTQVARAGAIVYSRMLFKTVDRVAGVGMDPMRSNQVKFVLAKYFLIGMMARTPSETTDTLAMSAVSREGSIAAMTNFENALAEVAGVKSQSELYALPISQFIEAVGKSNQWLSRLTFRSFLQNFTSMYEPPATLMMEDFGYFVAMLATHQSGSEIIRGFAVDPVYGREGDELIDEIARLTR